MQISKVNIYTQNAKSYKNQKISPSFASKPIQRDTIRVGRDYKGIMTYKEILSLKEFAEKNKQGSYVPNVVYMLTPTSVGNILCVISQDDLDNNNAQWSDITDYDSV